MIIKNSIIRQKLSQNRYKILFGVIGIILLLLILGNLSDITKQQDNEKIANRENNKTNTNQVTNTNKSNVYKPQETVIGGSDISEEKQEKNSNIINTFVEYCNKGELQKAYNMLTDECKELMYQNVQKFAQNYVKRKFTQKRQASMQSWYNSREDTYKVILGEDILATGKVNSENDAIDYITVVTQNNEEKLNIDNYIGRRQVNKKSTKNNITINIESKDMFMEYEIYNMKITNNNNEDILLDSKQNTDTVYLRNRTQSKYKSMLFELSEENLTILSGTTKSVKIKFNKVYNPTSKMISMNFDNIIMNIEEYKNLQDKTKYSNTCSMEIAL